MDEIKVAFLDDGININLLSDLEKVDLYTIEDDRVIGCTNINKGNEITHGTMCVKIFTQYVKVKVNIFSVEVLDCNKRCSVDKLITALNWVKFMGIKIVNLSLGTSFFRDEVRLRKCINDLSKSGHIIVSAQNNNFFATYPAAFTNVIGVSASPENQDMLMNPEYAFTGIELLGKSEHEVDIKGNKIVTHHANSFATPYITAIVANLYKQDWDILDMKQKICSSLCNKPFELRKYDWCNSAIILQARNYNYDFCNSCVDIIGRYYFDEVAPKIEEIKEICNRNVINTFVIIGFDEKIFRLLKEGTVKFRNLLIISEKSKVAVIETYNLERTLILSDQNLKTIFSSRKIKEIDIPIIVVFYNEEENKNALYQISKAKENFGNNEYNCKIFTDKSLGVLYGFEYWVGEQTLNEYIEFYMVDLIIVLISMKKGIGYIEGDLNLRFGISEESKEINLLSNIKSKNIYQYIIQQL